MRSDIADRRRLERVAAVWLARELLSEVYAANGLAHAKRRLIVFFQHAADANIPELTPLARTVDRWRDEDPRLPHHQRRIERTHRSRQPPHREDPPPRSRLPQLRELSTPATPRLRHPMDYRPHLQNQRPPPSLRRVEPLLLRLCNGVAWVGVGDLASHRRY